MRLLIYCDFPYRQRAGRTYAEQAFAVFLSGVAPLVQRVTLIGRLDPRPGTWHFELPPDIGFIPLPNYRRLSEPLEVLSATWRSSTCFWRALDCTDTALLFGPNPLALLFALMALARGRHAALGIRQDYIAYVQNRHPGRRWVQIAAHLLDWAFRLLARRCSVVAVGPDQVRRYAGARRLLPLNVTLVSGRDVRSEREALARPNERRRVPAAASVGGDSSARHSHGAEHMREAEVRVLSVGRLDNEKNPLLLADVLAELRANGERNWQMIVCGEGPLAGALHTRLRERGVDGQASLRGFVPMGPELRTVYRESDLFLHASHTEGVPQVLYEAFAAGLPVVATDVGGVASATRGAALLVPPSDPHAAAEALRRLAGDRALRENQVRAGLQIARKHTCEAQCARLVEFLGYVERS